jgi:hypothetical protein
LFSRSWRGRPSFLNTSFASYPDISSSRQSRAAGCPARRPQRFRA